ncbi:MAG TPA: CdaR family protein [Anaerolineales bacterium]|nr:CdaR family protein [Anaerolineales bacterium]
MKGSPLRWLAKNLTTLALAFMLALIVWVSAITSADPNEEHALGRAVPIEIVGQDPSLQIIGSPDGDVTLTIKAPNSVWGVLNTDRQSVRAWVDLSGLGAGEHTIPVQVQIDLRLVRLIKQDPQTITVVLEPLVTETFPLELVVSGLPPTGYQVGTPVLQPSEVSVSGPKSLVDRVESVRLALDIAGASETVSKQLTPVALDAAGKAISGLTITPDQAAVSQPIELLGGYRYVIIKAVSEGQVPSGYKLTNLFVTPVGVVVFSSDPDLVGDLPGYIETMPIDLTGSTDDFEALVDLNLPAGISVVGDPKVLAQVSIAAIESSLAVSLPVEVIGLTPGLLASVSPSTVDVILSGPVPILDALEPGDIRLMVDLTDYTAGTYQLIPVVDFLPDQVQKVSILPSTVEVIITLAPTPTPTLTPSFTPTPLRTGTPTPTLRP